MGREMSVPSPSSTVKESNSPLLTVTRRPRTRRKRPNQTYDEAAALLSTAYPTIFSSSSKTLLKSPPPLKALDLLVPCQQDSDFLFNPSILMTPEYHHFFEQDDKEVEEVHEWEANGFGIFDEEIIEGIDSFMGTIECGKNESIGQLVERIKSSCSMGLKNALREKDVDNFCRFSTVEFEEISPPRKNVVVLDAVVESKSFEQKSKLLLKLDYDGVLDAWSDKESPFSNNIPGSDFHARLGEIVLLGESGMREASVLRYKEKRRNRLFSNSRKIRYQVRKLNADQRPRMKVLLDPSRTQFLNWFMENATQAKAWLVIASADGLKGEVKDGTAGLAKQEHGAHLVGELPAVGLGKEEPGAHMVGEEPTAGLGKEEVKDAGH